MVNVHNHPVGKENIKNRFIATASIDISDIFLILFGIKQKIIANFLSHYHPLTIIQLIMKI